MQAITRAYEGWIAELLSAGTGKEFNIDNFVEIYSMYIEEFCNRQNIEIFDFSTAIGDAINLAWYAIVKNKKIKETYVKIVGKRSMKNMIIAKKARRVENIEFEEEKNSKNRIMYLSNIFKNINTKSTNNNKKEIKNKEAWNCLKSRTINRYLALVNLYKPKKIIIPRIKKNVAKKGIFEEI